MPESFPRRTALAIVLCAVAVLGLAFFAELLPRLSRTNDGVTSAPVPLGMRAPTAIPLGPGQEACQDGIVFAREGEVLQLLLDVNRPLVTTPLRVRLNAPGYARTFVVTPREHLIRLPLTALASAVAGTLCIRNDGAGPTSLSATADPRVLQRTRAAIDGGAPQAVAFIAFFTSAHPGSLLDGLGTTAERAAAFGPFGPWAFWSLLVLIAVAVPSALLAAYYLALRSRREE